MDIQVEDLPGKETDKSPQSISREDPISHMALASRFGITNANTDEQNKLSEIWAYAKGNANSENIPDIIWEVIHLEGQLGAPRLGESRLDRMYRYCVLKRQEATIQSELKGIHGVYGSSHL